MTAAGEQRRGANEQSVTGPGTAKVIRLAIMARELLAEMRQSPLDQPTQTGLRQLFDASIAELSVCLPAGLAEELHRLAAVTPGELPDRDELRLAQAKLASWLEGVLWGIQARLEAPDHPAISPWT
jgi:hypothetical protein